MTEDQLSAWIEYNEVEPFGEIRADMRMGAVVASYFDANKPKGSARIQGLGYTFGLSGRDFVLTASESGHKPSRKPLMDMDKWKEFKENMKALARAK